ncbi:MAG: membrane protein insertase YidC [Gemmatimonadaceae bacterium]|nr:membrane protein insertase YidC [Gemmatimonadaceae bacterium]
MDKRFFLALLLTGAVVIATPLIFRQPVPPPTAIASLEGGDTLPVATAPTPAGGDAAPATASAAAATPTMGPAANTAASAPAVVAETLTLANDLATYRFSTLGARFLGAELPRFDKLGEDNGTVQLEHGAEPMLAFRLIAGGDTIALDRIAFRSMRETSEAGERLVFDASLGAASTLRIAYTLAPDNYLTQVTVTASGLAQPAFLLSDLPTGFTSQEADTQEDARHLAYAFKPQSSGAERVDFRKPDPGERLLRSGPHTWVVAKSKYFLVGLLAPSTEGSPLAELHVTGAVRVNKIAMRATGTVVSPLANGSVAYELYAGPQEWERMVAMGRDFENANPYGGWISGVVQPFATIVMRILLWMKRTLNVEYGWILVLFGVAIRLMMWPLNTRMMRSQMAMQRVAPLIQEAQNKHKGDPERQREAVMKVYADAGVSPFSAFSGCLPMLIPMPILFALFFVFQNTIEFRGVPFLWLADISLKDPFYILPLAMGLSMYALSWVGMRNVPPNPQTKMMSYLMPVILTVALLNFASGLNLYYTVQNLAALPQQWLIANERAKNAAPQPVAAAKGGGRSRKS